MPVQISDGYYITHNGPLHLKITSIQSSLTRFFYRFQLHLTVFLRRGPSDRLYETTVWLNNVKKNTSGWAINQDFFVKVPFPVKDLPPCSLHFFRLCCLPTLLQVTCKLSLPSCRRAVYSQNDSIMFFVCVVWRTYKRLCRYAPLCCLMTDQLP